MSQPSSIKRKLIYVLSVIAVLYAANAIYGTNSATTRLSPNQNLTRLSPNQNLTSQDLTSQYKYIDPKTGYRMGHYRAPTPPGIKGATRIGTAELATLRQKSDMLLIDVMAHIGAGWDPLSGHWLISKPRFHIPGSIWLPDVGAGALSPELTKYFQLNIARLTVGNKSKPLVVYCQSDCWMSWNAVRRLKDWGYTNLYWYPEGHDGWVEANHKLVKATPVPLDIE